MMSNIPLPLAIFFSYTIVNVQNNAVNDSNNIPPDIVYKKNKTASHYDTETARNILIWVHCAIEISFNLDLYFFPHHIPYKIQYIFKIYISEANEKKSIFEEGK